MLFALLTLCLPTQLLDSTLMGRGADVAPQQLADALLPGLGKAMGLPPKRAVTVMQTQRSALRAMLLDVMRRQYPGESLTYMNQAYQAIGLLPPGADLRAAALDLYQGQIAGYYDPALHTMALVRGASMAEQSQVLQHELAHALQDQYFGLQNMLMSVAMDDDQAMALQAVVEGQAVLAMYVGMTEQLDTATGTDSASDHGAAPTKEQVRAQLKEAGMEMSDSELDTLMSGGAPTGSKKLSLSSLMVPATAPQPGQLDYLQAQLTFPYQEGTRFVESLLEHASFAEVIRRTLEHPPRSTRFILHPEVWSDNAEPMRVRTTHFDALPKTQRVYQTTVGELNMRTLLGGAGTGDQNAAALRGDRLVMLQDRGKPIVGWVTVWEDEASARAFAGYMGARPGSKLVKRVKKRVGVLAGAHAHDDASNATWDAAAAALAADLEQ